MNEAAEAESKRYREAIEALIIAYVDEDKMTKMQFTAAFIRETIRHYSAMYALGGGNESP